MEKELIAPLAATETPEEQEQLADELWPRFDRWVRARNRIQSAPARALRVVAFIVPRARDRERRPAQARRAASSSSTSSSDPGDPDESEPPGLALWRHPKFGLVDRLQAAFLGHEAVVE